MTSGVIVFRIALTVRSPSAPWKRNGPCASPMPTWPASVVSLTMTSLTWLIACVDVRTTCGSRAEREYVSSFVIFIAAHDTAAVSDTQRYPDLGGQTMRIGFIGLGNMGGPMALNLIKKGGHTLVVHDLRRELAKPHLAAGATWADSIKDAARAGEMIFTSLPGPADVEKVALGPGGIL